MLQPHLVFACDQEPSVLTSRVDSLDCAVLCLQASLPSAANRLASCLRDMAMAVEDNCDVVEDAVDEMAAEFVKARLPPYPSALAPKGDIPTLDSAICCRAPVRLRTADLFPMFSVPRPHEMWA